MKKIILVCLTFIMVLSCLVACDNNNNNNNNSDSQNNAKEISITALESEFGRSHSNFNFTTTTTSNGFSFEYVNSTFDATYSGTADKKRNVTSVTIVYEDINKEIISSKSKMHTIFYGLLNDPYSLTFSEAKAANCYGDLIELYGVLGKEIESETEILAVLCDGRRVEVEGWTISAKLVGTTFTITMEK